MKFTAETNELLARLNVLAKAQKKVMKNVLATIKIVVENENMTMEGNDGEMSVTTSLRVSNPVNGEVVVNSEQFTSMIRNVPNQVITFDYDEAKQSIVIKYSNGKFKMAGSSSENYMTVNLDNNREKALQFRNSDLYECLLKTKECVAEKDLLRPVFSGICFDAKEDGVSIVSTDCHSLMCCTMPTQEKQATDTFVIPFKTADTLMSVLAQYPESDTTLYITDDNVEIVTGVYVIKSRLMEGKFPNYEMVIPKDNNIPIKFNRKGFFAALKRVINFASTTSNLVKIIGVKGSCYYLSSEDVDFALSAKEMIEANVPEEDFRIGFNGLNLLNVLNAFDDEEICILAKEETKPIFITSNKGVETKCVLMPLQIND